MPIVTVRGIHQDTSRTQLNWLCGEIQKAAAGIPELGLSAEQTTVFFPSDLLQEGLGEELIVTVEGLFDKPERTDQIRQRLAMALLELTRHFCEAHVPVCSMVEVLVERPFDPAQGFARWEKT